MFSSLPVQTALLSALAVTSSASPIIFTKRDITAAIQKDFPDPSLMKASNGEYFVYSTTNADYHIPGRPSVNAIEYTMAEFEAMPTLPGWHDAGAGIWAPDVTNGGSGNYWMYFAGANKDTGKRCIGFATATDPFGPFTAEETPWQCDDAGSIDPDQFLDEDGSRYVLWKVDGNDDSTPIMLQQVDSDGHTKIGDPVELINRDEADGPLVEAPSLVKKDGIYYLTFSSNWYNTDKYDTSFATASSVKGPYTKVQAPDAPVLVTGTQGLVGPGGADLFIDDNGNNIMVWHGWNSTTIEGASRYMYASLVTLADGKITVNW